MTALHPGPVELDPASAAPLLADLGFLASSDLPDRPGPACLLVALREAPTLRHYDPEAVEYWVSDGDRGVRRTLSREVRLPIDGEFSWGLIRIVDRRHVTNEYLTFGGRLTANAIDGVVVAVFRSPVPLLRRGTPNRVVAVARPGTNVGVVPCLQGSARPVEITPRRHAPAGPSRPPHGRRRRANLLE